MMREQNYWVIVVAAGISQRFGASLPKQYCRISGQTLIAHSLAPFLHHPQCPYIHVVLSSDDHYWPETEFANHPKISTVVGGQERCHSVLNGLKALQNKAAKGDWVLIHDAARPLLDASDIDKLILELEHHACGGLLATPAKDTIKQTQDGKNVHTTLQRDLLWHALTPQMFRYEIVMRALENAISQNHHVTDEASAVEKLGMNPQLVLGRSDNIKITHYTDLALAEFLLQKRSSHSS